jgi:hypothetical protein
MAEPLKVRIEGEIPPGAERSSVRAKFAPDPAEDVQGHGSRAGWLGQIEEDVEGHGSRASWLRPVEGEDTEGHEIRYHFTAVEHHDAEGNALRSHVLEIGRNEDGELVGRYVPPEEDDDTEGQGGRAY